MTTLPDHTERTVGDLFGAHLDRNSLYANDKSARARWRASCEGRSGSRHRRSDDDPIKQQLDEVSFLLKSGLVSPACTR
jgi:hypothetical protein